MSSIRTLLILPHIKVHNANALSSPYTIGFPAMTAWLGAVHALQRTLNHRGIDVLLTATSVISHSVNLQTYKGENDYVSSIVGTGNPLDKTGSRPSFIEEARCHLDVSLVIEIERFKSDNEEMLINNISNVMEGPFKLAAGDILDFQSPEIIKLDEGDGKDLAKLKRKLMPGYVLVERRDLMLDGMTREGQDAIEALLDYLVIHHRCEQDDEGQITWLSQRKQFQDKPAGWIVPIATGFQGISKLGEAKNQRDIDTPHCFAESLVTLGEFKMAYRLSEIDDFLWRYRYDENNQLYLCEQSRFKPKVMPSNQTNPSDSTFDEFLQEI